MPQFDRRQLLRAGIGCAVPIGALSLFGGCQRPAADVNSDGSSHVRETDESVDHSEPENEAKTMQIQFLEIVTPDVNALCNQYSSIHGITFSEPIANLGGARTAKLNGGGLIGIRGPLRETETPVIRPYVLVDDLEAAVAAAADAGAEIAIPSMEIPDHGTIAIVIQGGIECGLWQPLQ